jgi:mono/diheme cytochrome c family protein
MKTINTITFLVLILLGSSCSVRRSEPFGGPLSLEDKQVKQGQVLYMKNCQKCHPQGEGGLGPALNVNPAPSFLKKFQVRHGLGVMPSFKKDEISKDELESISIYMRELKKNK